MQEQSGSGETSKDDETSEISSSQNRASTSDAELEALNKKVAEKLDPKIYSSFQKPSFVKTENILIHSKRQNSSNDKDEKKFKTLKGSGKKLNLKHKFEFY